MKVVKYLWIFVGSVLNVLTILGLYATYKQDGNFNALKESFKKSYNRGKQHEFTSLKMKIGFESE